MPIEYRAGLSKKVGLPNYGSLAASCSVEIEAEHGVLEGNPAEFQRRVQESFAACRCAVEDELARQQDSNPGSQTIIEPHPATLPPQYSGPGNGHGNGQNNPANPSAANGSNAHMASEKQLTYAKQLAEQIPGLGFRRLKTLAQKMYSKPLAAMTSFDASGLIDTLKAVKAGEIDLDALLNGAIP